jgi:hypothetical protein
MSSDFSDHRCTIRKQYSYYKNGTIGRQLQRRGISTIATDL